MVSRGTLLLVAGLVLSKPRRGVIVKQLTGFLLARSAANEVADQPTWERRPVPGLPDRKYTDASVGQVAV